MVFIACAASVALSSYCQEDFFKSLNTASLEKETVAGLDTFYDPTIDYSKFPGRVTDRDISTSILKVTSENANIKFFRIGDLVEFNVAKLEDKDKCQAYVRSVEKGYFVIFVKDLYPCWKGSEYFRRGTQLIFYSTTLAQRVKDASLYRNILLRRRKDFFRQLNEINHFIWSYDQERLKLASEYDQKIIQLEKAKEQALSLLSVKKRDQIHLQKELIYRLDNLDKDLDFFRVEKSELIADRWFLDHDLGHPVSRRPQKIKQE